MTRLMLILLFMLIAPRLTTLAWAQTGEGITVESVGIVKPSGNAEPQPADENEARARLIRAAVLDWLGKQPETKPAQKRAVEQALSKSDLSALRLLLTQPETVIQLRQRPGYVEVKANVSLNADAIREWAKKFSGDHPLKKLRIMVVIPEYHIQRPIPDPAGETEVFNAFLNEGFRMFPAKQVEAIRNKDIIKRAARAKDPKELMAVAQDWGADVFIMGEAFSQEVAPVGNMAVCRARIEAQVYLSDTGEMLASTDGEAGASDLASAVAAKVAIREAAKKLSRKLIDDLLTKQLGAQAQRRVKIVLTGATFGQKLEFEELLKSLKDISGVEELSFAESRAEMEVVSDASAADITKAVFLAAKKQNLSLDVSEQTGRRITFDIAKPKDAK
jgi:hypothetical protein